MGRPICYNLGTEKSRKGKGECAMLQRPPRVAAIHDLSGFGRCSLTVILPVLSAMKVQVCPVVTAVLSTHTGGLGEVVVQDLTGMLKPTLEHYRRL